MSAVDRYYKKMKYYQHGTGTGPYGPARSSYDGEVTIKGDGHLRLKMPRTLLRALGIDTKHIPDAPALRQHFSWHFAAQHVYLMQCPYKKGASNCATFQPSKGGAIPHWPLEIQCWPKGQYKPGTCDVRFHLHDNGRIVVSGLRLERPSALPKFSVPAIAKAAGVNRSPSADEFVAELRSIRKIITDLIARVQHGDDEEDI